MFYVINFSIKDYKINNVGFVDIKDGSSPLNWFINNMPEGTRPIMITKPNNEEAALLRKKLQNLENYGKKRKRETVIDNAVCA